MGQVAPLPCRKSYVVLMSDGGWNGSVDPAAVAGFLHTTDLRTDLTGTQSTNIYSVYTWGYDIGDCTIRREVKVGATGR